MILGQLWLVFKGKVGGNSQPVSSSKSSPFRAPGLRLFPLLLLSQKKYACGCQVGAWHPVVHFFLPHTYKLLDLKWYMKWNGIRWCEIIEMKGSGFSDVFCLFYHSVHFLLSIYLPIKPHGTWLTYQGCSAEVEDTGLNPNRRWTVTNH